MGAGKSAWFRPGRSTRSFAPPVSQRRRRLGVGVIVVTLAFLGGCATVPGPGVAPEAAATEHPDQKGLYLQLIQRMEAQGQYYAALAYLDKFDQRWPDDPESSLLRGRALRATGQLADAARYYQRLLAYSAFAAQGHEGLGLVAGAQGNVSLAVKEFEAAARLAPTDPQILSNLGYSELVAKRYDLAKEALFKAGELAPKDSRIWSNIALYYLLTGDQYRAVAAMDRLDMSWSERSAIRAKAMAMAEPEASGGQGERLSTAGRTDLLQPPINEVFSGAATMGLSH